MTEEEETKLVNASKELMEMFEPMERIIYKNNLPIKITTEIIFGHENLTYEVSKALGGIHIFV